MPFMDDESKFGYIACTNVLVCFVTHYCHFLFFPVGSERRWLIEMSSFDTQYAPSQSLLEWINIAVGTVTTGVVCALSA